MKAKSGFDRIEANEFSEKKQAKLWTIEDYRGLWSRMTVDFTKGQPILAMCCSKAEEFELSGNQLKIGFEYDVNMLILDDENNKKYILNKFTESIDNGIEVIFYQKEKPIDKTAEKIARLKNLFDNDILKITKK